MPWQRALRRATIWLLLLSLALLAGCNMLTSGAPSDDLNGVRAVLPSPTATHAAKPGNASASELRRQFLIRYTVDQMMRGMSLDEKLGQMFLIETTYKSYTWDVNNMVVGMGGAPRPPGRGCSAASAAEPRSTTGVR